jgi:hypothetical protein
VQLEEILKLLGFTGFRLGGDMQVGAVEAGSKHMRMAHIEGCQNIVAGARIGGGGQRDAGHAGENVCQALEVAVFGAEFVAPGADAMGFIDGDQGNSLASQAVECARAEQALGGDVEEVESAVIEQVRDAGDFAWFELGMQRAGGDTELPQGRDLVVHEGDQWGDDNGGAIPREGRHLVAHAFATAGRHEDKCVLPIDDGIDSLFLESPELQPKNPVQDILGRLAGI